MKKILLGLAVIVIFAAYAITQRHHPASTVSTSDSSDSSASKPSTTSYKDGTYTGSVANAFYGNLQVSATISGGKITAVTFLDSPHANDNSVQINDQAKPLLQQEAIKAQGAHVNVVSGATQTSQAFVQSLTSALSKAS